MLLTIVSNLFQLESQTMMSLVEGDLGGNIEVSVSMPPDLLCEEECSILLSAVVLETEPLYCPDNQELVLPQVCELCKNTLQHVVMDG